MQHNPGAHRKTKLAPRSTLQFKIGPHFTPTVCVKEILSSRGCTVEPILTPRIDRGFDIIDNEWVGYKRNYFTLVSSFLFQGVSFEEFAGDTYYYRDDERALPQSIKYFGLRLVARCVDDETPVNLIQHTAKRDRGPQFAPPAQAAVPARLPDHTVIREAANVRNINKISRLNEVFFFDKDEHDMREFDISGLCYYPDDRIIKVARYERVQFSLSINYKKPSLSCKRFKLIFELVGFPDEDRPDDMVVLAYRETPPLIIRGRSPSNYSQLDANNVCQDEEVHIRSFDQQGRVFTEEDLETFNILTEANNFMGSTQTVDPTTKKKRGRKPKAKLSEVGKKSILKDKPTLMKKQKTAKSSKSSPLRTHKKRLITIEMKLLGMEHAPETIPRCNILSEITLNTHDIVPMEEKSSWGLLVGAFSSFPSCVDREISNITERQLVIPDYHGTIRDDPADISSYGHTNLFENQFSMVEHQEQSPVRMFDERAGKGSFTLIPDMFENDSPFETDLHEMRDLNEIEQPEFLNELSKYQMRSSEQTNDFDEFAEFGEYA